jgi:D-alanyl-D-alanine carboxypeptidase (penicillin-binding protein 5/6)
MLSALVLIPCGFPSLATPKATKTTMRPLPTPAHRHTASQNAPEILAPKPLNSKTPPVTPHPAPLHPKPLHPSPLITPLAQPLPSRLTQEALARTAPMPQGSERTPITIDHLPAIIAHWMPLSTVAPHALILDTKSGHLLLTKHHLAPMAPSSMTKILTVYIVLQALKDQELSLLDAVPVSRYAAAQEGTRMFLIPDQSAGVEALLKGMIVSSGNDACVAIAEHLAGTVQGFAQRMNQVSQELGCQMSHWTNPSGLPDPKHYSCCMDLAKIAWRTIRDFPDMYKKYYALKEFSFNKINQVNRNSLLKSGLVDGLKTGYTQEGGYGIVASAIRGDRRLIVVINKLADTQSRHEQAQMLFNWGFQNCVPVTLFRKGQVVHTLPLWPTGQVQMIAPQDICLSLPRRLLILSTVRIRWIQPLKTPVHKDQVIGEVLVSFPDMPGMKSPTLAFPLVAAFDAGAQGVWTFFSKLWQ